ncbi:hypothetical protein GCM10010168_78070 [Actinoplanes ianthinogenes]|uniref:Alpha/beta hydrolase n=1 Tax=Actinoplanes ianthinogenes TaxID=122358 RepID=A0ABM7LKD0_9ACTN|nr:hypothetical protein [Actinoplanes ianthinogenes]BCJ39737.1 hypothetical protein Aiant_03940 [Actinoplanes ianthinogenes]GGR47743.1 hypothetical protein GCM10010168_78070 [Actinoplanes ianthinogenes]
MDAVTAVTTIGAPADPRVPSLVQVAELSFGNVPETIEKMRQGGLTVRVVHGAGHTIHRDDLDGFLTSMQGWL